MEKTTLAPNIIFAAPCKSQNSPMVLAPSYLTGKYRHEQEVGPTRRGKLHLVFNFNGWIDPH
jgi:hypothetical protein